jgi:hypothetical protein
MEPTHVCAPFQGRPVSYQAEAARVLFAVGRTVQSWHWLSSTCDEPMCLQVDHLVARQPLKLAYPYGVCIYCGMPGRTRDHLLPVTSTGRAARRFVATVPACGQCNSIIGDRGSANITVRRRLAHDGIRRRHAANLATRDWSPEELAEFGPGLLPHILEAMDRKLETLSRLAWPHDPSFDLRALELSGIEDPYATGILGDSDMPRSSTTFIPEQRAKSYVERAETLRGHSVGDEFEQCVGRRNPKNGRRIRLIEMDSRGKWRAVITWAYSEHKIGTEITVSSNALSHTWSKREGGEAA